MAVVRPRNDPVRLLGRRLLLLALLAVVIFGTWAVWGAYQKSRESAALRTEAQAQLADLSARQEKLNADIAKLETDRGVEEDLRQQYALAAKGEHLIVIVDPEASPTIHATSSPLANWVHKVFPWW